MTQRYRLRLIYDGTHYCGWQVQPTGRTIQQELEQALSTLARCPVRSVAAGRTDAGVHARGQVIHFDLERPFERLDKALVSLNGLLPPAIRVAALEPCSEQFHARYSAESKIYHYYLHTEAVEDPFTRPYRWRLRQPIDRLRLAQACRLLEGTHDFKAFANENLRGVAAHDSIRTLFCVEPEPIPGGICLRFHGDGFLYKMVRNCTGLLVEIAKGARSIDEIEKLLGQTNRSQVGYCAPAQGLFLEKVLYPQETDASQVINS